MAYEEKGEVELTLSQNNNNGLKTDIYIYMTASLHNLQ